MAENPNPSVYLLLRAKDGRKRRTRTKVPVRKGELVEDEVIPADEFSEKHNYRVYNEPNITLYCDIRDVGLLVGTEPNYLMAVSHELRIREFYNSPKKDYVFGLITGDKISFRFDSHSKIVKGRIRYLGPVEGKKGVYFGVDVDKDDEYRGKGATAGPIWVSMDMVAYTPVTGRRDQSSLDQTTGHADSKHFPVTSQRASHDDNKSSRQSGASNVASKVKNFFLSPEETHHRSKLYKEGDRVVIYSMKDQRPITATVRWTGAIQMSRLIGSPSMIFAGLELDSIIVLEKEFPEIFIDLTGCPWAEFKVKRGHTKLYVPEELLLPEADYKKQQIAEELELSVSHLTTGKLEAIDRRAQQKMIDEAKAHRIGQDDPILTAGQTPDYGNLYVSPEELKQQEELIKLFEQEKDSEKQARFKTASNQVTKSRDPPSDTSHYSPGPWHPYPGQPQHVHNYQRRYPIPAPRRSTEVEKKQKEEFPSWLIAGTVVVVRNAALSKPVTGIVKFIGRVKGFDGLVAGLELDEMIEGCGNGDFGNKRYFRCPDGRGYFCRICDLQSLDSLSIPSATSGATVPVSTGGGGASSTNPHPRYENDDQIAKPELISQLDSQLQKLTQEKEDLIKQSVFQQGEIKKLTEDLVLVQQDKANMKLTLSEQLESKKQALSQTQEQLVLMTAEKQDTITLLQQKTQESNRLQEENTHLQQNDARLRDEVTQLQSRIEQQPKLGSDSDISFWLVSHTEVHSTGKMLGRGGWGLVAVGSFRGQSVAVKELHSSIRSPLFDELLRREISLMAKIRHPNLLLFIAAVLDKPGRSDPIIVTELLDTDLRTAYQDGKLASNRVRLFILRDVAAALNYLHLQREPIIHRDVSSANVLLQALPDNKWRGKLSDFGSANIVQYASTPGPGNRQYTAPEVLKGEKQSTKMDVYSYGLLLCEIFTNQFPDPRAFPSMMQSMARSWPLMHRIVSTCVEHDPTKRPAMNSIVEQLNRLTN